MSIAIRLVAIPAASGLQHVGSTAGASCCHVDCCQFSVPFECRLQIALWCRSVTWSSAVMARPSGALLRHLVMPGLLDEGKAILDG